MPSYFTRGETDPSIFKQKSFDSDDWDKVEKRLHPCEPFINSDTSTYCRTVTCTLHGTLITTVELFYSKAITDDDISIIWNPRQTNYN